MLELRNITKRFNAGTVDETTVFDGFDFKVEDGDFVSVIGSNGSGKTTLLNLICGSLHPDEGKIIFNDRDITNVSEYKRAKIIGRVFQDPKTGTCPDLTILENMALADNKNKPFGLGRCVNKKRIEYYRSLLEQCDMGLENRLGVQVGTLSGGQRQALALVIANMTDLDLLILDEHIAALDPKSSERVMEHLYWLRSKLIFAFEFTLKVFAFTPLPIAPNLPPFKTMSPMPFTPFMYREPLFTVVVPMAELS